VTGRSEAFQLLFAYIAGANRTSASGHDKIAMTVPVEVRDKEQMAMTVPVQTAETNGAVWMQFFLPAKYGPDNAPKPVNARVKLTTIPEETIATLRYSGSGKDFKDRQSELVTKLGRRVGGRSGHLTPYIMMLLSLCLSYAGTRRQLRSMRTTRGSEVEGIGGCLPSGRASNMDE